MHRFSPRSNRAHLVRWREWGEDAFAEARAQKKPLAVFITAFWCGFCQRMDETSLSSDGVIALLNAFFIPVRLEESQRPDVDLRYNQDGWPTIAFLTPGGTHLGSVNYTPPPEFVTLLARIVDYWQQNGEAADPDVAEAPEVEPAPQRPLRFEVVEEVSGLLEGLADPEYGGFGGEIKLLHTEANEFLLYRYETTGEPAALEHVLLTLKCLRGSRTFDPADGGFFRYSSRRDWEEPHPEKLLDDQATLLGNYLHAYLLTEDTAWRETAEGLIAYLGGTLSEGADGPFFGCQDYVRDADGGPLRSIIDRYIYCDANAHAASACIEAWWLLGREDCRRRAEGVLGWLWRNLHAADGGMQHYWDGAPRAAGLLGDAVAMGLALLDAYAAFGDESYLQRARELARYVIERHRCAEGGFYDISEGGPANLRFPLTLLTQNAGAATLFLRIGALSGDDAYRAQAEWALRPFPASYGEHGAFAAGFGQAVARYLTPPATILIEGTPGDQALRNLLRAARIRLRYPNLVLRYRARGGGPSISVVLGGKTLGPLHDASEIGPALLQRGAGE